MKIILTLIACLALITGCATGNNGGSQVSPARVASITELAAFTGTTVWLRDHPQDKAHFVAAHTALGVLLNSTNVAPADIHQALSGLPINELKGENGTLIVGAALILYDAYLRENVNLDANEYLRPVVNALHRGIGLAIGQ